MDSATDDPTLRALTIPLPPTLRLSVTEGPCASQSFQSSGCFLTVGRTKRSSVYLKDGAVSERHAEFAWNGRAWTVRDVGSSNGTRINSRPLPEAEPHELQEGDVVSFGTDSRLRVDLQEATCADVTVEQLLRAYYESSCQKIEDVGQGQAKAMVERWRSAAAGMAAGV